MTRDLGPWAIPSSLLDHVERSLPPGSTILEFGSGHGTIELCKNYTVYSVEDQSSWIGMAPSLYIYAPIKNEWYDTRVLDAMLPKSYDLIIVDGPHSPPPYQHRRNGISSYIPRLRDDVPVLVDDIHIPLYMAFYDSWCAARGVEPCVSAPDQWGRIWGRVGLGTKGS